MTDYIQVPVDLLSELAESLACELDARYPASVRSYESQDRKYMAEMEPVLTARRIIAAAPDHIADARKMVAAAVQGEPVGYVRPHHLEMLRSGKACGITLEDKPDAHNRVTIPLYATAPDVAGLVEALECALETMENVDGANDCSRGIDAVEEALAAYRKQGGGQ